MSEVLERLDKEGVRFVDLQLTDVPGKLHHVTVTREFLDEEALERGVPKLDGSSIRGFVEIYESDLVLKPDPSTYALIPWSGEKDRTARFICDVYATYGRGRLEKDPRYIAQRAEEYLKSRGFEKSYWGPEAEFFVFDKVTWDVLSPNKMSYEVKSREAVWGCESSSGYPIRFKEGYFPTPPQDTLMEFRNEVVTILRDCFGIPCNAHHHEVATAGQCEIDMAHDTLVRTADNLMTYKYVVKNVAVQHGLVATFMPKPIFMDNASGMHVHISLWKNGGNTFYDPSDEYAELSQVGRYFTGGILEHSRSLAAIVAPTTNSYRRFVQGFEAPIFIAWSRSNRSANVRIPTYHKEMKNSKRIEFRTPDPSCNPYLAFAAILMAGLNGISKKIDPGDPVDENIYHLSLEKRRALGIKELPRNLGEAIDCLESDNQYLKPIFNRSLLETIIEIERKMYSEVAARPHPYEFHLYFDV